MNNKKTALEELTEFAQKVYANRDYLQKKYLSTLEGGLYLLKVARENCESPISSLKEAKDFLGKKMALNENFIL